MVAKLLGIRAADRRDTLVGFATLVAILAGHSILETARDALFLAKLPPEQLPLAYIAIAAVALVVARANRAAAARWSRRRLLSASLLLGGLITAVFWQLTAGRGALSLGALYVWTGTLATVVVVQFWLQLGDVLDVLQAKRLFSLIAAGGLVGATLGSGAAGLLIGRIDARDLLLVSAGIFVASAGVPLLFSPTPSEAPQRRRVKARRPQSTGVRALLTDAYLVRLFLIVLVGAVLVTGVDYVFKAKVVAHASATGADLGTFFARYYAIVNGISLVVQLIIAPRLLANLGVNRALLVMPILLLVGALGFAVTVALVPALLLKGADGTLRHSVHRTASEILYLPLARPVRERFKGFAEALGQRGGQALASLIILGVSLASPSLAVIGIGLAVLAVIFVVSMVGIQPHYLELFRKQLREGTLDTRVDVPALDLSSFETLLSALSAEDDTEVLAALALFESYGKTDLVPALILFHPSREVVLRAYEMFERAQRGDVRRLSRRLLDHPDDAIRAAALRAVVLAERDEELLRGQLGDDSASVRATALAALVSAGQIDAPEEELLAAAREPEAALALAQAAGHLSPEHVAAITPALIESGLRARVELARSLAAQPQIDHVATLIELLGWREPRHHAREALLQLGDEALAALGDALEDDSLPHNIRLHLPRTISRFHGERAVEILVERLARERDRRVVLKILRGLGRMRTDEPSLPIDRAEVLAVAEQTLQESVNALFWRLAVGKIVATFQGAMTPASELLVDFLNEKHEGALQRVFRLLHILEPSQEFRIIYDGLRSDDAKTQASSRELLSNVVAPSLRDGILALVGEAKPRKRLAAVRPFVDAPGRERFDAAIAKYRADASHAGDVGVVYADTLRDMLAEPSQALRSIVGYHIAELGLDELTAEVKTAQNVTSDNLATVAVPSVRLFDMELSGAG